MSYFGFDFKLFITGVNIWLYNSFVASLAGAHLRPSSTAPVHLHADYAIYTVGGVQITPVLRKFIRIHLVRERLGENYIKLAIIDEHD